MLFLKPQTKILFSEARLSHTLISCFCNSFIYSMRGAVLAAAIAGLFAVIYSAVILRKPVGAPAVVGLDIYRDTAPSKRLRRRGMEEIEGISSTLEGHSTKMP